MNKKHVVVAVLLVLFFVSAQTTQAFSLKAFFNSIFGKKAAPVEQKSSLGASAVNSELKVTEDSELTTEREIESTSMEMTVVKPSEPAPTVKPATIVAPVKSTKSETTTVSPTKSSSSVFTTEQTTTVKPNTSSSEIKVSTPTTTIKPGASDISTPVKGGQRLFVTKILRYGMKNDAEVKILQNQLKYRGYLTAEADGNYGKMTVSAVIAFQKAKGLPLDGMAVGAKTLPYLDIILIEEPTTTGTGGIKPPKPTTPILVPGTIEPTTGGIKPPKEVPPTLPPAPMEEAAEKVLMVSGSNQTWTAYFNDVYASSDATHATWTLASANSATTTTKWSQRKNPEVLYFNNKFWVIGGGTTFDQPQYQSNEVWSSSDGVAWTRTATNVPFNTYDRARLVAFNGKMYAIDGSANGAKVYSSTDGATWTTVSSAPAFGSRANFMTFAFNGKIYVMGGEGKSDTWTSTDGATWTKVADNASWGPRTYALVLVKNGKAFLIGGWKPDATGSSTNREIWTSTDGVTWTMLTGSFANTLLVPTDGTNFSIYQHGFVADGKLWLSGSSGDSIWSSTDGIAWTRTVPTVPWSVRSGYRYISSHTEQSSTPSPAPAPAVSTCAINSFTAPTTITSAVATNGGPSMTWSTSGCTKAWYLVNYGFGSTGGTLSVNGTQTTGIGSAVAQNDTTYDITLYAANDTFVTSKSLTIPVTNTPGTDANQCSINSFAATPNPATNGQTVTLSWSSTNCPNIFIQQDKPNHVLTGNLPSSGYFTTQTSTTVSATGPMVYTIIGVKNDGLNPHGPMNSLSSKAVNLTIQ